MAFEIRDARDEDGPALVGIIGRVFTEYPGCVLDVDGEMPELRAIASSFRRQGGRFWVATRRADPAGAEGSPEKPGSASSALGDPSRAGDARIGERIVGCVGLSPAVPSSPPSPGGVELRKLYVDRRERGAGIGRALCECVEREARLRGAAFVELWTDTRFEAAHRLYAARGYVTSWRGETRITRELHDKSASIEYHYRLALT